MRAREFLMKDAYSFHADFASLEKTYQVMYETYSRIFSRLGLKFRAVAADTGAIGGSGSHEFHVLADSGEDALAYCPTSDYAANVELAEAVKPDTARGDANLTLKKVSTPGQKSIDEVAAFLTVTPLQVLKSIALVAGDGGFALLLLRGDHTLNEVKVSKILGEFRFATDIEIQNNMGCRPGYIGPINIPAWKQASGIIASQMQQIKPRIIVDRSAFAMSNFVCGANEDGFHYTGVNFGRDIHLDQNNVRDLRNVVTGDTSPDGKGTLEICRGIEVGHIFQLRTKYAEALKATYLDAQGKAQVIEMGCYGIGVSRIVAAAIEQNFDERGITLPTAMAPFQIAIVPIGMGKSETVRTAVEQLYQTLQTANIEVLLDDRDERPGVMFADMELIGIPHRIVIGDRGLKEGTVEYQGRCEAEAQSIPLQSALEFIKVKLCN
jgi:prolyl-tRNA synthetase